MVHLYVRLCLLAFTFCSFNAFAQQTSIQVWQSMAKSANLSFEKIYQTCPHFPRYEAYTSDQQFTAAVQLWKGQYGEEEKQFWNLPEVKKINPSAYYLGLSNGTAPKVFGNSIWEWVKNSAITDIRLKQIAAHFPSPKLTANIEDDEKKYTAQLEFWMALYPLEYEKLFNAPELTALNPDYKEYHKPVIMPAFISAPLHETKPAREKFSQTTKGELKYQLSMRVWYFVFEPQTFQNLYAKDYEFPKSFDAEKFRNSILQKIKDTKNPPAEMIKSHPGK